MASDVKRILFVGREKAGVEHVFHRAGGSWAPLFAPDARAAMSALADGADIVAVVADANLEGASSGTFLNEVRDRFPLVLRLSRAASSAASTQVFSSIAPGSVSVRDDVASLQSLLERTANLDALLKKSAVQSIVGGLDRLPAPPNTYLALSQACHADVGLAEIAAIIERDPVTTLKLLQLVNSAFFGLVRRIPTVSAAAQFLGLEALKSLVLAAQVLTGFESIGGKHFSPERFQLYSMRVAKVAARFAKTREVREQVVTAGILHDIGELVLALRYGREIGRVAQQMAETRQSQSEVETELFGANHAEVGACLLATWGVPSFLAECAAYHHEPSLVAGKQVDLLACVHVADALIDIVTNNGPEERLDQHFLERAGFPSASDCRAIVVEQAKLWVG